MLACASVACSGEYPLGSLSKQDQLLDLAPAAGSVALAGAALSPVLGAPDVTIGAEDLVADGPGRVAAVGDLDADGFGDMAVAAWDLATNKAYVHVRYGGPRPSTAGDALEFDLGGAYLIAAPDSNLLSVTAAGDVDGDGYADLLVRSPECQPTKTGDGAYLVYGGLDRLDGVTPLANVAAHFVPPTFSGDASSEQGVSCIVTPSAGAAGDMDGDGIDDFVLSTTAVDSTSPGAISLGRGEGVYVFYGRSQRFAGEVAFGDADAKLEAQRDLTVVPTGDVDGDGLGDLLIGSADVNLGVTPSRLFFVPGRAERWSGDVNLETRAVGFDGLWADGYAAFVGGGLGDLDGDGINDVVLRRDADSAHVLFYGAPGLFAQGADEALANARLASDNAMYLLPAGDRDGDGDDEFVEQFHQDQQPSGTEIAIVGGSSQRLSGTFPLPEAAAENHAQRFLDAHRAVAHTYSAGDLDGDGAGDLVTQSLWYQERPDGTESSLAQLHIHYGSRAPSVVR